MARRDGNLYRGNPRPDLRDQRRGFCRLARTEPSRHISRARQQVYGRALAERAARLGWLTPASYSRNSPTTFGTKVVKPARQTTVRVRQSQL